MKNKSTATEPKAALHKTDCSMQLPLAELKDILSTIESVEENQILGNHKEVRRLIFKAMFDLRGVIAAIA